MQKGNCDLWIYKLVSGVICHLKYIWPVSFLFHFMKTSWFLRNLMLKKKNLKFPLVKCCNGWNVFESIHDWFIFLKFLWPKQDPFCYFLHRASLLKSLVNNLYSIISLNKSMLQAQFCFKLIILACKITWCSNYLDEFKQSSKLMMFQLSWWI